MLTQPEIKCQYKYKYKYKFDVTEQTHSCGRNGGRHPSRGTAPATSEHPNPAATGYQSLDPEPLHTCKVTWGMNGYHELALTSQWVFAECEGVVGY